ncbi:MAG TPA: protein kinase [Kofleriaceae bacterium]|nr:protein kinase [Kofleriaceae bacterium]
MREQDVVDGRYRIERKLAAGGFGAIYAATDLIMGREVAIKVLHRELASDALLVARFRREAEALARLRDPHTVTMYDVGADADGTPYIVLELLRGETLYQHFLNTGPLPWRRMAQIAHGVCSSLREAHAVGIIHRDLKPANIHLEVSALQQDQAKVLDFGIAKLVDAETAALPDLTLAGQMIGTFDYMPPEQLIGGACSGKSDVFALAVVMYEMIAGQLPFSPAQGPASRLMAMLTTPPVPLAERANVPPHLDAIIMRALSHEIDERPDMEELDNVLVQLIEGTKPFVAPRASSDATSDASSEINALIDEALRDESDDGAFPDDDGDTWVGAPPQSTTIGLPPTRPAFDAEGTGQVRAPSQRFAVGSRTEIPPASNPYVTPRRVTPAHVPPPPPRAPARNVTPVDPMASTMSPSAGVKAIDPLASTMSPDAPRAPSPRAPSPRAPSPRAPSPHLHIDARSSTNADSQAQTARQPRRVLTPPSGTSTNTASARAEIERLANRSRVPVVRIVTPPQGHARAGSDMGRAGSDMGRASHDAFTPPAHRVWQGRPTPSDMALPPAPSFAPSGELPTAPSRMATGTTPIVNQPTSISMARVALWALVLFALGFAAAIAVASLA